MACAIAVRLEQLLEQRCLDDFFDDSVDAADGAASKLVAFWAACSEADLAEFALFLFNSKSDQLFSLSHSYLAYFFQDVLRCCSVKEMLDKLQELQVKALAVADPKRVN